MNIAIVGGGVAGVSAALLLHKHHSVTLYEKNNYVGGHTNTITLEKGPDSGTAVDTGFIVCNDRTYPNLHNMFKHLDVSVRNTDMSFGYNDETTGYCYSGKGLNGLFAQRSNFFKPRFWSLIKEVVRFYKIATRELKEEIDLTGITMGVWLKEHRFSSSFILDYLIPMGGAIWSSSNKAMLDFPAELFLHFFQNHGLINLFDRPQWQTVEGGSFAYIKKFITIFEGELYTEKPVSSIKREKQSVEITLNDGSVRSHDTVIIAAHADEVLPMLSDPSENEIKAFTPWDYIPNHTVLHTDSSVMPLNKRAWASWNFTQEKEFDNEKPISLTYDMNNLQGLKTNLNYFVTLNRTQPIPREHIIKEINYKHPNFTIETLMSRAAIKDLNSSRNTYFTGSYLGYGFHEDAVKASVDMIAKHFNIKDFS